MLQRRKEEVWQYANKQGSLCYAQKYLDDLYEKFENINTHNDDNLALVTKCVVDSLCRQRPRQRYVVGHGANVLLKMFYFLPASLSDHLILLLSCLPSTHSSDYLSPL